MNHSFNEKNRLIPKSDSNLNQADIFFLNGISKTGLNLLIIGKDIKTINETNIDFLAIDESGKLISIIKYLDSELNKVIEKYLDISLWIDNLTFQKSKIIFEDCFKINFEHEIKAKFNISITNLDKTGCRILLVTELLDPETELMLDKMVNNYNIAINAIVLSKIKDTDEYIFQRWYFEPFNENKIKSNEISDDNSKIKSESSWNDSYLLGIQAIDLQHKYFFKIYDDLLKQDIESISDETKHKIIEKLQNYVLCHFQTEEILLKRANYPDYDQHVNEHKLFINKVNEFKLSLEYQNTQLINQMLVFIRKWFLSHISNTDPQYKNSLRSYITNLK